MSTVSIDTYDLEEAEEVFSAAYSKMHFSAPPGTPTHTKVERSQLDNLTHDEIDFNYELKAHVDPLPDIALCRVHSGILTQQYPGGHLEGARADEITVVGSQIGKPFQINAHSAHYDVVTIDRARFDRAAGGSSAIGEPSPATLTGTSPISPEATAHLISVVDHITRDVMRSPYASSSPLVIDSVSNYLASALLQAFPTTALLEPTIEDRHDSTPALLRKAIAFIDDNAERSIAMSDIAESIYVSPRSLQYMFRKHLDTTPTEYLRRVRLHQAHLELVASDRMRTTVGQIAAGWGFGHLGRFASYYRQHYGVSPHQTLRR
ncbi:helix-turn-helix transcriptional regulator [Rhodococcus sp. BP-252]|uniref:HTH araC/xylS-type domain-containing protein n=1 Tax=Rhodococcoides kyotonense TaxID=398843 RepID=A0A177YH62_9NOCA|nr:MULTISPECIES: helix-turn-helix transcriptional regulator [Rhodococcus]NIL74819.1 HTH-type transcriptional activator RhaS [Rhodococcus sp. B10]MBY6412325.1 helix-turn-helix transcriptional regulator [Rhodococcus sp. BP-320]MBY6416905.1 helix-turn-helix transcriptional regulator [Rhodococcus sp. BP-321]MBY6421557.1 helix-turn-helix transcriptional regulator [Rhodococcus sp. BP-324]MBY6426823.1 helix-turn-helix transcriptional regulator [Rhodococcus sp. BP-323]